MTPDTVKMFWFLIAKLAEKVPKLELGLPPQPVPKNTTLEHDFLLREITQRNFNWLTIDDRITHGKSECSIELIDVTDQHVLFSGNINSEVNAVQPDTATGYCIARSEYFEEPLDLSKHEGIALEVRSWENRVYSFCLADRIDQTLLNW